MKNNKKQTMVNSALQKDTDKGFYHKQTIRKQRRAMKQLMKSYTHETESNAAEIWLDEEKDVCQQYKHDNWVCCEYLWTSNSFRRWVTTKYVEGSEAKANLPAFIWRYTKHEYEPREYYYKYSFKFLRYETKKFDDYSWLDEIIECDATWLKHLIFHMSTEGDSVPQHHMKAYFDNCYDRKTLKILECAYERYQTNYI